jgi:DNA-binding MarR family transcriptional regulator
MPSNSTTKRIMEFASRLKGVDPQVLQEGLEIAHVHRQVEQAIENDLARRGGLTARQVEIMESLYHNAEGTMTPAELADEVLLSRSAMTSSLDSLEKLGHTVRAPHPSDRRMVAISLTPSGREFIGLRLPERYEKFCRVMSSLSKNERTLLLRTYGKVIDLLRCEMGEDGK